MDLASLEIERLTFRRISVEWAQELASQPGALNESGIFTELIKAFLLGEFDDAELTIEQAPRDRGGKRVTNVEPLRMTRNNFAEIMALAPGCGITLPTKAERRENLNSVPWSQLADKGPADFDEHTRKGYLEPLTISREHFGRW